MTADFNGDGKTDIATVRGTAVVTITLGVGNGDFRSKDLPFDLGPGAVFQRMVAAADFNGDHIPDLLAITQVAPGNSGGGVVLLGIGDGTFRTPIQVGPDDVRAVTDFNRDGKLDLRMAHCYAATGFCGFAVRFGNGEARSSAPVRLRGSPLEISRGTWWRISTAMGNPTWRKHVPGRQFAAVYLWLGNGDGTFGNVIMTQLADTPTSSQLATADVNGDGRLDLAVLSK